MNDVEELKRFVIVHARAQSIPARRYRAVLDRVRTDEDGTPGSWTAEWTAEGHALAATGAHLDAARCYNMARFPFVDGPARQEALASCVRATDLWRQDKPVERIDVDLPKGRVGCWAGGLSAADRRPLVVVMGGIVSIKEQWAPIALMAGRLGMAVVVTELPGVGENTLPYDLDSWRVFPAVLDAVAGRADVSRTYAVALSFSGHSALRWAVRDDRLRGLVTVGAPVANFFTDRAWFGRLPRVTVDTLAHLTGTPAADLPDLFRPWALGAEQLRSLDIPVHYTASLRDEIIPPGDVALLRQHVRNLHLKEYDDVHSSPGHTDEIRLSVPRSLLRMSGGPAPRRAALAVLAALLRLRQAVRTRAAGS